MIGHIFVAIAVMIDIFAIVVGEGEGRVVVVEVVVVVVVVGDGGGRGMGDLCKTCGTAGCYLLSDAHGCLSRSLSARLRDDGCSSSDVGGELLLMLSGDGYGG